MPLGRRAAATRVHHEQLVVARVLRRRQPLAGCVHRAGRLGLDEDRVGLLDGDAIELACSRSPAFASAIAEENGLGGSLLQRAATWNLSFGKYSQAVAAPQRCVEL